MAQGVGYVHNRLGDIGVHEKKERRRPGKRLQVPAGPSTFPYRIPQLRIRTLSLGALVYVHCYAHVTVPRFAGDSILSLGPYNAF